MNFPEYYEFSFPVKIISGHTALNKLPVELAQAGLSRPLVITDPGVGKAGLLEVFLNAFAESEITIGAIFDQTPPESSTLVVNKIADLFREKNCDSLIALGGGSVIDTTKGVNILVSHDSNDINQFRGADILTGPLKPFYVVPTTAGTGSEATNTAVIQDLEKGVKMLIVSELLMPKAAVLDTRMTLTLPPKLTAATGMDALTHAVEAYTNLFAPRYTRQLAEEAVALIFRYLKRAYADGKDLEAREQMLYASFLAGRAFSRACVGNVHAIAHTVGGLYGTPHGLANAVILPFVLEAYGSRVKAKLARLADLAGVDGSGCDEKARRFIEKIRSLNQEMGIEGPFDFIRDEDIPQMIRWAMKEANPLYPVPVIFDEPLMRQVIERVRTAGNSL